MNLYDRIFKPRKLELPNGKVVEERFTRLPLILLIVLICTVVSVHITGFNFAILAANGKKFFDILWQMFPPNTEYLPKIWQPLWDTTGKIIVGHIVRPMRMNAKPAPNTSVDSP